MYTEVNLFPSREERKRQETAEMTILKNFIASIDYHLGTGELSKVNEELNSMCKYILKKEGYQIDELPDPTKYEEGVDILSGFKKPAMRMGMNDLPAKPIPHTKYDWYKWYFTKLKPTLENVSSNT